MGAALSGGWLGDGNRCWKCDFCFGNNRRNGNILLMDNLVDEDYLEKRLSGDKRILEEMVDR